jgi:hypothetical protein
VNHTTTIGIAAILTLAVFTPALFAASTAYAGGHGDGDSISIKSKFKQKNICWAIDDSRTTCRNDASVFGANEENNNNNNEVNHCPSGTVFDVTLRAALPPTLQADDELCLTSQGENKDVPVVRDNMIVEGLTPDVVVTPAPNEECNEPQQVLADVTSGQLPSTGGLTDPLCVNLGPT